jgi:hypothetical protein
MSKKEPPRIPAVFVNDLENDESSAEPIDNLFFILSTQHGTIAKEIFLYAEQADNDIST